MARARERGRTGRRHPIARVRAAQAVAPVSRMVPGVVGGVQSIRGPFLRPSGKGSGGVSEWLFFEIGWTHLTSIGNTVWEHY